MLPSKRRIRIVQNPTQVNMSNEPYQHIMRLVLLTRYGPILALALAFIPAAVHAQTIKSFLETAQRIVATAIAPVLALALLSFFLGVIQYLGAAQRSSEAAIKGRNVLVWGIVVLFVLVSIWGIVEIVRETFGFN